MNARQTISVVLCLLAAALCSAAPPTFLPPTTTTSPPTTQTRLSTTQPPPTTATSDVWAERPLVVAIVEVSSLEAAREFSRQLVSRGLARNLRMLSNVVQMSKGASASTTTASTPPVEVVGDSTDQQTTTTETTETTTTETTETTTTETTAIVTTTTETTAIVSTPAVSLAATAATPVASADADIAVSESDGDSDKIANTNERYPDDPVEKRPVVVLMMETRISLLGAFQSTVLLVAPDAEVLFLPIVDFGEDFQKKIEQFYHYERHFRVPVAIGGRRPFLSSIGRPFYPY